MLCKQGGRGISSSGGLCRHRGCSGSLPKFPRESDRRMVPRAPTRPCEQATESPECQAPRPLPVLRTPDELPQSLAVLSEGPLYLEGMAESTHTRAPDVLAAVCRYPAAISVATTADHTYLGRSGEYGLRNPLRETCTAGSVRGSPR